ncbi:MAG: hypothetical protein ACOC3W_10570 [Thermodesulfobacteriota bacterium]
MKKSVFMEEEKLVEVAIEALLDRLGPVETNRFLTLPRKKRMESVKRHRQWQQQLDKDAFFNKIFAQ